MNHKLSSLRPITLTLVVACSLLAVSPVLAVDPTPTVLAPAPPPLQLWAAGDADSVYLILAHQANDMTGFRVFCRSAVAPRFVPGRRYSGAPATVTSFNRRCHIFFSGGYHQSYDCQGTRTERKLPDHLVPLACSASSADLYVLARLDQPVTLDPSIALDAGAHVIMVARPGRPWRCLTGQPLPISDWQQPALTILDNEIHLFGIGVSASAADQDNRAVQHVRLDDNLITPLPSLPQDDVRALTAMTVNRQICLILLVDPDYQPSPPESSLPGPSAHYYLAKQLQDNWATTGPLEMTLGQPLQLPPDRMALAPFAQSIAAFAWRSEQDVLFGSYALDGQITNPLANSIAAVATPPARFARFFFSHALLTVLTVTVFILVFWRRREAFLAPLPVPDYIQLAPLWRRLLAFVLDIIPITIVSFLIVGVLYPQQAQVLAHQQDILSDTSARYYNDPAILHFIAVWLTITTVLLSCYGLLWESFLAATPGKMALKLTVLTTAATPAPLPAILLRNLVRILECLPNMPLIALVLILLTKRRQRLGDLVARTIVVSNSPELQNHLQQVSPLHPGNSPDDHPDSP